MVPITCNIFSDPSYQPTAIKIRRWLVPNGALVKPGDLILEIETDKVAVEMPATAFGKLIISTPAGTTVRQTDIIGEIDDSESPEKNVWPPAPARSEEVSETYSAQSHRNFNLACALFIGGIALADLAASRHPNHLVWEIPILALPIASITLFIREAKAKTIRVPWLVYVLPTLHIALVLTGAALGMR